VTQKYYNKIFSLMDAQKAKEATDRLCNLQMSEGWNTLDIDMPREEAGYESPAGRGVALPDYESDGASSTSSSPRKKKKMGRSTPIRLGGPWCEADEITLVAGVQGIPADASKRWVRVLAVIQPDLKNPNRTPENLKDKFRNIEKFKSRLLGIPAMSFLCFPLCDNVSLCPCVVLGCCVGSPVHMVGHTAVYTLLAGTLGVD
jgi:hypothetical protein